MKSFTNALVFAAIWGLAGCSDPAPTTSSDQKIEIAQPSAPPVPTEPTKPVFKWDYRTDTDEMRGTSEKFASLSSNDLVGTSWPYDREPMRLILRRRSTDGLNAMLQINGQFVCRSYSGDEITVKFDDGPLETFRCNEASSGSNNVIFIGNPARFVSKVKTAKTMMLEAPVYESGNVQVTFDVAGLEWDE